MHRRRTARLPAGAWQPARARCARGQPIALCARGQPSSRNGLILLIDTSNANPLLCAGEEPNWACKLSSRGIFACGPRPGERRRTVLLTPSTRSRIGTANRAKQNYPRVGSVAGNSGACCPFDVIPAPEVARATQIRTANTTKVGCLSSQTRVLAGPRFGSGDKGGVRGHRDKKNTPTGNRTRGLRMGILDVATTSLV